MGSLELIDTQAAHLYLLNSITKCPSPLHHRYCVSEKRLVLQKSILYTLISELITFPRRRRYGRRRQSIASPVSCRRRLLTQVSLIEPSVHLVTDMIDRCHQNYKKGHLVDNHQWAASHPVRHALICQKVLFFFVFITWSELLIINISCGLNGCGSWQTGKLTYYRGTRDVVFCYYANFNNEVNKCKK